MYAAVLDAIQVLTFETVLLAEAFQPVITLVRLFGLVLNHDETLVPLELFNARFKCVIRIHLEILCHSRILSHEFLVVVVEQIDASAERIEQIFCSEELAGHDDISRVFPSCFG